MTPTTPIEGDVTRSRRAAFVRRLLVSRIIGQAAIYTVASGAATGLSGVAKAILAREMHPSSFGSFSFALAFVTLVATVFDFGLFNSAARRLARSDANSRRELVGACLTTFVPLAVLASAATFGLSFVVDGVFHVHAGDALRVCSLCAWAWTFPLLGELLAKGVDRLYVYSISNLAGSVALLVSILVSVAAGAAFSTTFAFLLATVSMVVSMAVLAAWLRPKTQRIRTHVRAFMADARAWAFQMYAGRFFSISTYNMDVLMVAWFSNAKSTGYYSLAGALAGFMGLPMLGVSAALFPRMARQDLINRSWLAVGWAIGAVGVLVVVLIAPPAIDFVFGAAYRPVAPLAIPLILAQGVRGVTTVYVTFMSAHARGREMRNVAFILTGSNLIFNFTLIPPFGATGAAWASLLALLVNYVAYVSYYRRYVRSAHGS